MSKSMVMGGGTKWTGHLVYKTRKTQEQVIDFTNATMQNSGWTKLSELRGNDTVITFMKNNRVATAHINVERGYISKSTLVFCIELC